MNRHNVRFARSKNNDNVQKAMLYKIERELEKKVIAQIRKRQQTIPGLKQDELQYTAVWGGDLTPGCKKCCLKGKVAHLRTTTQCSLNCSFCYYFGSREKRSIPSDMYLINERLFTERDIRLLFKAQGKKFLNGVGWLYYEPLMEIDKMIPVMKMISQKGYHQWLYTNGVFATHDNLKKLADAGLNEIRFNLAATNCSAGVIQHMACARKYFKYLCVESPMFTGFYEAFIKNRRMILETGLDHIHCAELQLFTNTKDNFKKEGPAYRYAQGYISPIKSRHLTYNLIELAVKEKWENVVIHDCSNETKFFRGVYLGNASSFGIVEYKAFSPLWNEFYRDAINYLNSKE